MANAFTDRWIKKKREEIPISPVLPPPAPSLLDWIRQPIATGPGMRAPIWDPTKPGLSGIGNIPAGFVNNSPIPMIARGLTKVGELERKAYDWATTPEGAAAVQNGGGVPTSPPFKAALPNAPGGEAALASSAASPSGGPGYQAGQPAASFYRDAIAGIESAGSGDYSAIGEVTNGDRPYGRYQVMGDNIPSWTQAALGRTMTPEEFLADPAAQDAVFDHQFGSYLAKGSPADAASRWHSGRPLSEAYGAKDVLGTRTPDYVNDFQRRIGGELLPPAAEAYQAGAAPQVPNPVDAPLPSQPDFSKVNDLISQAAPQRAATPDRFTKMLSALASANANTDTRGPGAVSRLFANWGAGLSSGSEQADVERVNAENEFTERQRDFLLRRAEIASSQEGALRTWKDSAGETTAGNQSADQVASFQNDQNRYTIGEANKKMGWEAGQKNKQNLYDWQKADTAAGRPTVIGSGKDYIAWQNPDGSFEHKQFGASGLFPGMKEPEVSDPMQEVAKYDQMEQVVRETGNMNILKEEVVRDDVKSGSARQIFGPELYDKLLEEAVELNSHLLGTDEYLPAVQNAVAVRLLQEKLGDDSWIPYSAAYGNYGATKLYTGGMQGVQ